MHDISTTRRKVLLGAAALTAAGARPALAQTYPGKQPIRWIVPYGPGGGSDTVARLLAEQLGSRLGQRTVVVENRPGAGGTIGAQAIAAAAPDGYVLGTADNGTLYNNWHLFEKLPYKPDSFEYVTMMGTLPLVLVVNAALPIKSFDDWVKWAKSQNGKATYGTPGIGSPHHLALASLSERLGLQMVHVPYKGDAAAMTDLVGGQIHCTLMAVAIARQFVNDGRIRLIAVTSKNRLNGLSQVPTFAENGVNDFDMSAEQGILMPAGTPADIVKRISQEMAAILATPSVIEKLEVAGMFPLVKGPAEFRAYAQAKAKAADEIIRRQGISLG